jgi:type II secretory pathway component GspD/PulD (secretin)
MQQSTVERSAIRHQAQQPTLVKLQPVQGAAPKLAPPPSFHLADSPSAGLRSADGTIQQVAVESTLLPLASQPPVANVDIVDENGLVTLVATGAELSSVLRMIADTHGMNLVLGPEVAGPLTVSIRGARLEEVLDAILGVAGFAWNRVDNLLYVTGASATGMDPRVQGRTLQVYQLDYVAASDVEAVANGLISPVGNAYISQSDPADHLRTREVLVVEDTAAGHRRIAQFIAQIDTPPRQVLIEAHVLQVSLSDEERHGIDWRGLAKHNGAKITLEGSGFADTPSGNPALTLQIDGRDMDTYIELIREHSNSRTLASPKISVVNHQEAKIQIGQRLPYSVATTTQTTTVQSVEFLEVGIVLTVQPVITADGNVLMTVLPKVSGGKITPNGFPEEDTTEVQTTILMQDGGGVIIGGLIREENIQARAIIPYIGRIPILGRLFRRSSDEMRRNEVIVALVTHVLPEACGPRAHEVMELDETLPDYAKFELLQNQLPIVGYP